MTLHDILGRAGEWTWWWYTAIPNRRRGTIHLLRAPVLQLDEERLAVDQRRSTAMQESFRRSAMQMGGKGIPFNMVDQVLERACRRRQRAARWQMETWDYAFADNLNQRGICSECVAFAMELDDEQRGTTRHRFYEHQRSARQLYQRHRPYTSRVNQSIEDWEAAVEAYYYSGDPQGRYV
jgi:hypothetical protein